MPIGPQPAGREGTSGRPYSALNLRLALASFGLVTCAALAFVAFHVGVGVVGALLVALALTAAVDIVVIQRRRIARRREDPTRHSLFE